MRIAIGVEEIDRRELADGQRDVIGRDHRLYSIYSRLAPPQLGSGLSTIQLSVLMGAQVAGLGFGAASEKFAVSNVGVVAVVETSLAATGRPVVWSKREA